MSKRKRAIDRAVKNMVNAIRGYHEMRRWAEAAEAELISERVAHAATDFAAGRVYEANGRLRREAAAAERRARAAETERDELRRKLAQNESARQ